MKNEIFELLKFKIKLYYNSGLISVKTFNGALQSFLSTLIFLSFGIGTFLFTKTILQFVIEDLRIGLFLLHRFISMVLFVFFFSINAGNLIVAYSMIFKSREVQELMTKPINHANIFIFKMFESILYSSPVFLLIGLGILAGYGFYFKMPWYFYPLSFFLLFLPFVFISAILGIIELIFLINVAKKIGLRKTSLIVIVLYLLSMFAFFKFMNPKNLVTEVMKYYPNINFDFHFLDPKILIYLPNHWFSEAIHLLVKNNHELSYQFILITNLTFLFLLITAVLIGNKFYYKAFLNSLELKDLFNRPSAKQNKQNKKIFYSFTNHSSLDSQTEVILKKEFHQFFRDPAQWIHLSVIVFLIIIFISSIAKVNLIATLPLMQTVTYLIIYIFNSFIISSITLRFLYPIISIEAEAFWKIKSAPVQLAKLIKAKIYPSLIFVLLISGALNFFSHLPIREHTILFVTSSINIISTAFTLSAINFGMGSYFVTFNEKNPVKIASSQGATIAFLINLLYLIFLVIVLFVPTNEYFSKQIITNDILLKFIFSSLLLFLLSIILLMLSLTISIKKLSIDFH